MNERGHNHEPIVSLLEHGLTSVIGAPSLGYTAIRDGRSVCALYTSAVFPSDCAFVNVYGARSRNICKRGYEQLLTHARRPRTHIDHALSTLFVALGRPLPRSLRSPYILEIYRGAIRKSIARPYAGGVVYIKSEMRSATHAQDWAHLAEDFEMYERPGTDHVTLLRVQNARIWAEKLRTALEDAQCRESPQVPGVRFSWQ